MLIRSLGLLLFLFGCADGQEPESQADLSQQAGGPVADDPLATSGPELPSLPEGQALPLISEGSSLAFVGAKVTASHNCGFESFSGEVVLSGGVVVGTRIRVDLASTFTDAERLTRHLLSDDFFHVERFPEAVFVSSDIRETTGGAGSHSVNGVLEFHGVRHALQFPATIEVGDEGVQVSADFSMDRNDWGVSYPGKVDNLIKAAVQVEMTGHFAVAEEAAEEG